MSKLQNALKEFMHEKMNDLPKDRMSKEPLFTFCGVDMFEIFLVKNGCKEIKRYGDSFLAESYTLR